MNWTDDEKNRASTMWTDGHSATEISREVGRTRNAVLGLLHRQASKPVGITSPKRKSTPRGVKTNNTPKLALAKSSPSYALIPISIRKGRTKPPMPPAPALAPPPANPVRFFDLGPSQCAWPVSDDKPGPGMACCGAGVIQRESALFRRYCESHAKRARALSHAEVR